MKSRIFLSPPHMGDLEQVFVRQVFDSNYIAPVGPAIDEFERAFCEYTGIGHCVALASGTAAMHLALKERGVGPGDEVIGSTLTFVGSIIPVIFLGGSVVLVDCDRTSWNMDPDLLERELEQAGGRGRLPKAVVPTDLYGQYADYDRIFAVCDRFDVPVVVDAAEAMGVRYGRPGGWHAGKGPAAAVLDERVQRRREIFEYYRQALKDVPGIEFMPEAAYGRANRWLTVILITPERLGADREDVRLALEAENIESRPVWKPMHLQPVFQTTHPCRKVGGNVSEDLFARGLCLPSGTAMTTKDLDRVIAVIQRCGNVI